MCLKRSKIQVVLTAECGKHGFLNMDCIFCKIIKGDIKAKIISESAKSISFLDAFPLSRGHTLIIPKKHYEKIQDIPQEDNADLFELVRIILSKVDKIGGSTLVAVHNGKDSGQIVPHVHVHLIPRSKDDGAGPVHSMFKPISKLTDEDTTELLKELQES